MMIQKAQLKLCSPAGGESVVYSWPLCMTKQYNGAAEIIETIRWIGEDYPEVKIVIERFTIHNVDTTSFESMKNMCDKFNGTVKTIKQLWQGVTQPKEKQRASTALLRHIVQQVYNHSVSEPDKLNQYEPFSPEVYGETSYDLIAKMIEKVDLTEDDLFIDLGSGVGQVVLQIAGGSPCYKCIGIEKGEWPNKFAVVLEKEFRKWMKWYGKKHQPFELINGDFLDEKYRDVIMQASVIFVNNFAFGPEVDHKVEELASMPESVSWTGKPVTYYLHTIDRSKLEDYFACIKNNPHDVYHRVSLSKSSSSKCSSRDSSSSNSRDASLAKSRSPQRKDENVVIGTTTRRQWSNWIAQQEKMKTRNINSKMAEEEHVLSKDIGSEKETAARTTGEMKFIITGKTQRKSSSSNKSKKVFGIKPVPKVGSHAKRTLTSKKGKHGSDRWMRTYHWVNQKHKEISVETTDSAIDATEMTKNKALDVFLDSIRRQFENFLIYMQSDDYRRRLLEEIETERIKNRELMYLCDQREKQIKKLQEDGLELLQARLEEVDIVASSTNELLTQAKEIVIYHKALQSKSNSLQDEIQKLEHNNEILGFPDNLTREEVKMNLAFEIDALFGHRKMLMTQQRKLEKEIRLLEEEFPEKVYTELQPFVPLNGPPQELATKSDYLTLPTTKKARRKSGKSNKDTASASMGAIVADQRRNDLSGGPGSEGVSQSQSEQDIEERIKDMVRKALSVDTAAKNAEKERKARNAEKRREEKFKRKTDSAAFAASTGRSPCDPEPRSSISASIKTPIFIPESQSRNAATEAPAVTRHCHPFVTLAEAGVALGAASSALPPMQFCGSGGSAIDREAATGFASPPLPSTTSISGRSTLPRPSSEPTLSSSNPSPWRKSITPLGSEYPRVSSAYEQPSKPFAVQNLIKFPTTPVVDADQGQCPLTSEAQFHTASPDHFRAPASLYPATCMDFCWPTSSSPYNCVSHAMTAVQLSTPSYNTFRDTASSVDSGYAGTASDSPHPSVCSSGRQEFAAFTPEPISYRNKFKNSSNTGNPGNPHDYSNPGNPVVDDASSTDVTDPKPLQPFRIPRKISHELLQHSDAAINRSPLATTVTAKKDDSSWRNALFPSRGKRK
ncbi:unnamed protein product [Soboliphyme baturini]|uniref:Histone-lysine N-methyltransferase, H3 lysine-79 specific n=1 Tax=Soboliphyme baturini TaxID=241478 RepID=A0A183IN55_9BILA|nr:unnamed protein product [Soboliphyme baturini]